MRFRWSCLVLLFVLVCSCAAPVKAQLPKGEYTSTNKRAIAHFENALQLFNARKEQEALDQLKKAVEKDSMFVEPHLLMAEIYTEARYVNKAISEHQKAININPTFSKNSLYNIAILQQGVGRYEDAKKNYQAFLKFAIINPDAKEVSERGVQSCNFAIEAMRNPKPFQPKNMGPGVNSNFFEYFPAITADGNTFMVTRNLRPDGAPSNATQEDFYISHKVNGKWDLAKPMGAPINTSGNEGAPTLSADGQVLFFAACEEAPGMSSGTRKFLGSCDIFYSQKSGDKWSTPINVGPPVNSTGYETQPSFSSDGKTLYYIRRVRGKDNRPHTDIFYTVLDENGEFGQPKRLPENINTLGNEESVFIHPDNQTLYFASDGHLGMGGLDLFVSRRRADGSWGDPVNLGYPINTWGNENSLLVNPNGDIAYFASTRDGGLGGLDMYEFELYSEARPNVITYMKGKVYDQVTKKPLAARFELLDPATGEQIITSQSNPGNGEFLVTLPAGKAYALNVSKKGYLFFSEGFNLTLKENQTVYNMDVPLQPIDTGSVVELKNIFFETAKFDLKPESKAELQKLVGFLNANPGLKIQLAGHTDNVGDKKANMVLSQNRAKAVYDYLISQKITAERLSYKGFGDTKPKVPNDSAENRQKNRRTEFRVTGK